MDEFPVRQSSRETIVAERLTRLFFRLAHSSSASFNFLSSSDSELQCIDVGSYTLVWVNLR